MLFFFFKHKTAYEMRISDWSSDVCSSDLILDARYRAAPMGMGFGRTRFSSQSDSFALLYAAQDLATALAERIVRDRFQGKTKRVLLESDVDDQIGRASCRERVCQYV